MRMMTEVFQFVLEKRGEAGKRGRAEVQGLEMERNTAMTWLQIPWTRFRLKLHVTVNVQEQASEFVLS